MSGLDEALRHALNEVKGLGSFYRMIEAETLLRRS